MRIQSIKDVNYLRTFEAAGELKSYRIKNAVHLALPPFALE